MNHNKKRNTAFLYEALVRELTKSVVEKNEKKKAAIVGVIKEFFNNNSVLKKELKLYNEIIETRGVSKHAAEKIICYVKKEREELNTQKIFEEQTHLVNKIHNTLIGDVLSNFVPNYKALASVYQMLSPNTKIKNKVLMEGTVVRYMSSKPQQIAEEKRINNSTMRIFSSKFNNHYSGLLEEQRILLSKYISSFTDNGLQLKVYLNDELGRIKEEIAENKNNFNDEVKEKINSVLSMVEDYKGQMINEDILKQILKIQQLVSEIKSND
jgi:Zn-dependent oligopeptidase